MRTLIGHEDWIVALAFHSSGYLLASAGNDRKIHLWNLRNPLDTQKRLPTLHGHEAQISKLVFHPNGTILASGSCDHTVRLWDIETDNLLHVLRGHSRIIWSMTFSADGERLYSTK